MELTDMDLIRAAIINAMIEDMDVMDLWACAEHAKTPDDFEEAVNLLAQTVPNEQPCAIVIDVII